MSAIRDEWTTEDGSVRLLLGDCLEILPGLERVDAVVTDPPYGVGESSDSGRNSSKSAFTRMYGESDWDSSINQPAIDLAISISREAIVFGGNYYTLPPSRCWLVWDKMNTGERADCELAWTNLDRAVRMISYRWNGMIRDGKDQRGLHPTQKPVDVIIWCLSWLRMGQTILDPFMGSGTTGVACIRLGRKFVGIEREPKYFEIAKNRIQNEFAKTALIETPKRLVQTSFVEAVG